MKNINLNTMINTCRIRIQRKEIDQRLIFGRIYRELAIKLVSEMTLIELKKIIDFKEIDPEKITPDQMEEYTSEYIEFISKLKKLNQIEYTAEIITKD